MNGESGRVATLIVCAGEEAMLDYLCERLSADRFEVLPVSTAAEALRFCRYHHPDLMVLDAGLPDDAAFHAVREIREADGIEARIDPRLPIVAIVVRGGEERARCFDLGVDECLARPFSYEELSVRVASVLRRRHNRRDEPVRVGELIIDPARRIVSVGGRQLRLPKKEFTLLRVLASDPTRVFSKDELLREVWGLQAPGGRTRTLDSHASRLRRKLDPDAARYVVNSWGVGYSLVAPRTGAEGR